MSYRALAVILGASVAVAACGRVEIPAQNAPPRAQRSQAPEPPPPVAAPTRTVQTSAISPPTAAQVQRSREVQVAQRQTVSDAAFVGANAVKVGPGDTVYALSRRHRVPVPAIIRANNLKPPYLLNVGQRIVLPRGKQHKIGPGDTLYSIAQSYDVGLYELARLNDIGPPYTARLGATLVIPESEEKQPAPTAKAAPTPPPPAPKPAPTPAPVKKTPRPDSEVSPSGQIVLLPPTKPPVPVPPPPARSGSGFIWPVKGTVISNFGAKKGGLRNDGINIRASRGTPIFAAENGVVAYAGNEIRGFGNLLLIKHTDGYITAYAHGDKLLVSRGQKVKRGQHIATVGSTGSVGEPQLHFEVRKGRRPQDPKKYLRG